MPRKVLVLGAGVSGLTTALELLKAGFDVTVWSKEPAGQYGSTSFNAYAIWTPCRMAEDVNIEEWCFHALEEFNRIAFDPRSGVRMMPLVDLQESVHEPWYASSRAGLLPYLRRARPGEIPSHYPDAHVLEKVPVVDPHVYLAWLAGQIVALGGRLEQMEVAVLSDCPSDFEAIVNCTALGAKDLVGDEELYSLPMQVLRLRVEAAENLSVVVFDQVGRNAQAHIIPHENHITIGATYGKPGSDRLESVEEVTAGILARCSLILPGFTPTLKDVIGVVCCLRPKRPLVRVAQEKLADGRRIIHNYGHDGKAFIVSWGVASTIVQMLEERL